MFGGLKNTFVSLSCKTITIDMITTSKTYLKTAVSQLGNNWGILQFTIVTFCSTATFKILQNAKRKKNHSKTVSNC